MTTRNTPIASIIIPTYNRSSVLSYTLESICQQTVDREAMEVIVVDDGSSDNTPEVIERYRDRLNMIYIYQEDRGNRTGLARNKGIQRASSPVCIFIDSGMLLSTKCIEAHVKAHQSTVRQAVIGYAYCFEEHDEHDQFLCKFINVQAPDQTISYFKSTGQFSDLREKCYRRYCDKLEDLPAPWVFFWTCNVSVRRSDLLKVGLFDENFDQTWGFEDIELAYRLQIDGVLIVLKREAESIHYPHGKEDREFKAYSQHRNKHYFHEKHNSYQSKLYLEVADVLKFNDYLLSVDASIPSTAATSSAIN